MGVGSVGTVESQMETLPFDGYGREKILESLVSFKSGDVPWNQGRMLGYVYNPGEDPMAVAHEAYMEFLTENGLDWTVFPSMHKMETDLVHIVRSHVIRFPYRHRFKRLC